MDIVNPGSSGEDAAADSARIGTGTAGLDAALDAAALLPVLDASVLKEMEAELTGTALAQNFVRDYVRLWDQRYARLAAAINSEDDALGLDAVTSLRVASAMVGGVRLAGTAEVLERLIRRGDFGQGGLLMDQLGHVGDLTVAELRSGYLPSDS